MQIAAALFSIVLGMAAGSLWFENSQIAAVEVDRPGALMRFEIDPAASKFIVHANRGGLAWFKGHNHLVAVRDFKGTVELTPGVLNPASLELTVNAASLEETSDQFTPQQKGIINREMKEIVLESEKYPEITFRSHAVKGKFEDGKFKVKITGDMTLHGVTKQVTIPATVSVDNGRLHAVGEFELERSDFNVKATSAFHGLVRIQDELEFEFDIVAK